MKLLRCLIAALLLAAPCYASSQKADAPRVFGWLEKAIVMPVGATVKVKLDSGALTSSMDAKNILTFKRKGKNWVSFRLHLEDKETGAEVYRDLEMPVTRFVRLTGAGGQDRRHSVTQGRCSPSDEVSPSHAAPVASTATLARRGAPRAQLG